MPQDTVLFNDTIGYNIATAEPGRTGGMSKAAAAPMHEFIAGTPGVTTPWSANGAEALGRREAAWPSRTLLKNPPILIFDEATSALDSANERAIQAELEQAAQGKTALVIAPAVHRGRCARDRGAGGRAVIERGSHAALLAAGGRYAQMWQLQRGRWSPDI